MRWTSRRRPGCIFEKIKARDKESFKALGFAALAGVAFGCYMLVWPGALLVGFMLFAVLRRPVRHRSCPRRIAGIYRLHRSDPVPGPGDHGVALLAGEYVAGADAILVDPAGVPVTGADRHRRHLRRIESAAEQQGRAVDVPRLAAGHRRRRPGSLLHYPATAIRADHGGLQRIPAPGRHAHGRRGTADDLRERKRCP